MNGLFAANFVQGLQGTENRYIRANAGCKHFDAYAIYYNFHGCKNHQIVIFFIFLLKT